MAARAAQNQGNNEEPTKHQTTKAAPTQAQQPEQKQRTNPSKPRRVIVKAKCPDPSVKIMESREK